ARALGIPLRPPAAARLLLHPHRTRALDVAVAGGRALVHMGGSGFDALIMRGAQPSLKRIARWLAYVPPALKHLRAPEFHYRVTVDGTTEETRARMVLVANGSFVLDPWFRVGEGIRHDDGVLDVCIFTPPNFWGMITLVLWFLAGRVERSRHLRHLRGREIRIDAAPPAPVELDGDYAGTTPIELRVHPAAVQVIVPAEAGEALRRRNRPVADA
ncbi:MAG: hypothetical protein QJR03_01700, partial [Sphaerobacter sp.]|nr:hypothetical protein [Sphaerobacter sp.]